MTDEKRDVIAAISTPSGRGAISCVRLSGVGSVDIARKFTEGFDGKKHGMMVPCKFVGRIKDKIMAVAYLDGRSYTGEESVELYFHGGKFLTEQALLSLVDGGARIAEAGEFTRRAFLSGKIDLTQAEGIGDLIDGDNFTMVEAAYEQSEGKIKKAIDKIYDETVTAAARAEVCIDYPEEDIEEQTRDELKLSIMKIIENIDTEINGYGGGKVRRDGAIVTLTGNTNAGKSTLFNTLLDEDRAIVSDEEGTTRDTVEEKLIYKGVAMVLVDTAGIRETCGKAEKLGIERSKNAVNGADIVIEVVRKDKYSNDIAKNINSTEKTIKVINVFGNTDKNACEKYPNIIELNAKSGDGVDKLREELYARVKKIENTGGCINNARQYEALVKAKEALCRALEATDALTLDCVCADIGDALRYLGNITGKNASDSVIDEIFSKFCVGK